MDKINIYIYILLLLLLLLYCKPQEKLSFYFPDSYIWGLRFRDNAWLVLRDAGALGTCDQP